MEAGLKLARQFFCDQGESRRSHYIACNPSYHGNTLATLSLGFYKQRRQLYEDILLPNMHHVSACNPYLDRKEKQSDEEYVREKKDELISMFNNLGGDQVIAFVIETVTGAVSLVLSKLYLLGSL
jgi:adenosylmethionine-8-amino-7-oxononanoate aminotransferase